MKSTQSAINLEYRQLCKELAKIGWISSGYAQNRGPGAGGPCYQWSRKVRAKTVSVALSEEQFVWLQQAIANQRKVKHILQRMEELSRTILFKTIKGTNRRKPLSKNVMGII